MDTQHKKWKVTVCLEDAPYYEFEANDMHNDGAFLIVPKTDGTIVGFKNEQITSFWMTPIVEEGDE